MASAAQALQQADARLRNDWNSVESQRNRIGETARGLTALAIGLPVIFTGLWAGANFGYKVTAQSPFLVKVAGVAVGAAGGLMVSAFAASTVANTAGMVARRFFGPKA